MIICENCFASEQIRQVIRRVGHKGNCPTCRKKNCYLIDTDNIADNAPELLDWFGDLLSHFTYNTDAFVSVPNRELVLLKTELFKNWNIFSNSLQEEQAYDILVSICRDQYQFDKFLFEKPVVFREKYDIEELKKRSVTRAKTWEDFISEITKDNRYHTHTLNLDMLERLLSFMRTTIPKGSVFYRCRINDKDIAYKAKEMGPPPEGKATSGRANAPGISCLYLASDANTAIAEVRAGAYDHVTIGKFKLNREIPVIDFRLIKNLCPLGISMDYTDYAINHDHLIKINDEMAKGLKSGDHLVDYVVTQYITDFVKSIVVENKEGVMEKQYWGIIYNSTLHEQGHNLAIFYKDVFKCISTKLYQVKTVQYSTDPNLL